MELTKQGIEVFLPSSTTLKSSKSIFTTGNGIIRTGNEIISSTLDQKISFTKYFSLLPKTSKLIFQTENEVVQTGNGIIQTQRLKIIPPKLKFAFDLIKRYYQIVHIWQTLWFLSLLYGYQIYQEERRKFLSVQVDHC